VDRGGGWKRKEGTTKNDFKRNEGKKKERKKIIIIRLARKKNGRFLGSEF